MAERYSDPGSRGLPRVIRPPERSVQRLSKRANWVGRVSRIQMGEH